MSQQLELVLETWDKDLSILLAAESELGLADHVFLWLFRWSCGKNTCRICLSDVRYKDRRKEAKLARQHLCLSRPSVNPRNYKSSLARDR